MQVIEGLIQGTPQWHAHRMNHFNASDAPAMMGCSPYKTRAQLIKEVATGLAEEVDAQTQRLFDDGHRTEALARPIAERILGEDLYPVVGTNGVLSASFDGITMSGRKDFECKRLNKRLREAMTPGCTGADLPLDYQVQMEQQHAVNEECEETLFVAAEFDADGNLVEERHCFYTSNPELRARIVAGWKQFEADVAAYQPAEVVPAVVAEPVQALPAVLVKVTGEIAITANFSVFETAFRDFVAERLITEPKTDQDFADLDLQIKAMKGAEAALDSAEAQMLAQITSVDTAKKTKDMLAELVRKHRLSSEKLLESEKQRRRAEIVSNGQAQLRGHIAALCKRVGVMLPTIAADIAGAIKNKRTLASMEDAVATELARAKIEANRVADLIDCNRKAMEAVDAAGLFPDFVQVCAKPADDFANLVGTRKAAAEAAQAKRLEGERERIRQEEAAKAERKAREEKEAEDNTITGIWAAARRIEGNRVGYVQKAIAYFEQGPGQYADDPRQRVADAVKQARAEMQEKLQAAQEHEARERDAEAERTAQQQAQAVATPTPVAAPVTVQPPPAPAPEVRAFRRAAAPVEQAEAYTVRLGEIQALIAPYTITAEGIAQEGFQFRVERGMKFYRQSDARELCLKASRHFAEKAEELLQAS